LQHCSFLRFQQKLFWFNKVTFGSSIQQNFRFLNKIVLSVQDLSKWRNYFIRTLLYNRCLWLCMSMICEPLTIPRLTDTQVLNIKLSHRGGRRALEISPDIVALSFGIWYLTKLCQNMRRRVTEILHVIFDHSLLSLRIRYFYYSE